MNRDPNQTYATFRKTIENPEPKISANVLICLTNVTTYLLRWQLKKLEKEFIENGGLKERMHHARKNSKK